MFRLYHRVLNLLEPEPLDEVNNHENRASLSLSLVRACVALDVDVNTGLRQDDGIFGAIGARSSGEIDGDGHPEATAEPLTQASVQADSNPDPDANETATHKTHTSTHTTTMHTKPASYHLQEQVDLTRTLTGSKTMAKTYFETKHPQISIYPPPSLSLSLSSSSPSLSPSPSPSPLQSSSHSSSPHSPHHHLPLSSSSSSSHPEPESILIPNAHTIYPSSSSSIAE
ncbi:hypothetical protein D9758_017982 [Tetrapyrgos nigripes]|uniref:Uncharacterized protein n=1 Tax=Tetrapyrgos nigripes TaxID=182062 RepID=A0A8H5F956_9AGAR|nr:hypothetical protein D9758_017982 [Tetrapyrgos nigripes]